MEATRSSTSLAIERVLTATNGHDLEALVACFRPDFVNETPSHPARSFRGRDQVRRNWAQIFAAVPDLEAEIVRMAVDGQTAWLEWDFRGNRADGSRHSMRGVTVFGVEDGEMAWVRFYVEPVDDSSTPIDQAVKDQLSR